MHTADSANDARDRSSRLTTTTPSPVRKVHHRQPAIYMEDYSFNPAGLGHTDPYMISPLCFHASFTGVEHDNHERRRIHNKGPFP